ncbi:MAG: hypothetical protein KAH21_00605, partial [Spirochaetaceae bacterium]|nr:hypothetical protein [Spirochaetaceae bacterium]
MNIFPALKDFLDASPTSFHAAEAISAELESSSYIKLDEKDSWKLKKGQGYYIVREGRAVIAFIPGSSAPAESGLRIAAAHLDSPVWKVKTEGAALEKGVWRLPVEPYGSPIYSTWVDRELEIAGMVTYRDSTRTPSSPGNVISKSWRSGGPTVIIPSLAIHFNKDINKGIELNPQNHMAAVLPVNEYAEKSKASETDTNPVIAKICTDLGISESDYLASELYLVPSDKASFLGTDKNQLIVSGRLDNLAMSYAILESLPDFNSVGDSGVLALWFDAEEVGSRTSSGASSIFSDEIIERIVLSFNGGRENLIRCRRNSFLISVDMAHAVHPNYSDRHDPSYMP